MKAIVDKTNLTIPDVPNVSLVAFYGDKPVKLAALIQKLQSYLADSSLGEHFVPHKLSQVHGTIIGCEGLSTKLGIINQWYSDRRQEIRYMDLSGLIDYLQHQVHLPTIRFGGYDRHGEYNFLSRAQHLYERSFQFQPATAEHIPILIGWSWQNEQVSLAIDSLRRNLQQFNLLHKYHATPDAMDNDFYLRLGTIDAQATAAEINAIAIEIRNILAISPLSIPIDFNSLAFVQYQDLQLTAATTKVIPVAKITPDLLVRLYPN